MNGNEKILNTIYIVINTKGGAGKTTTATQNLAPYLYTKILEKNSGKPEKIKLYEVDVKNNSQQAFANTKIFESILLSSKFSEEKTLPALENLLYDELSNNNRGYPIVIDMGVEASDYALNTLTYIINETNSNEFVFLIPAKSGNADSNNTVNTIKRIKEFSKNPQIIVVCADSATDINNEYDMKLEFNKIFGTLYKWSDKKYTTNIFKTTSIPEIYLHIPRNIFYDRIIDTMKATFYEAVEEGRKIEEAQRGVKSHKWLDMLKDIYEKQDKAKSEKEKNILREEHKRINMQMGFFRKAYTYYGSTQTTIFKKFDKIFLTNFFVKK